MAAIKCAKAMAWKPTMSVRTIKRKIGYDTEDDDVHEMRKGMVNMAMNVDLGCTR
jgi:hypothetical protein